jgi:type III secretion system YscQ/HrcQ family protein
MKDCRAFRWDLLPRVPRSTVAILRGVIAQLDAVDPAAGETALGAILGAPVSVRLGPVVAVRREEIPQFLGSALRVCVTLARGERRAVVVGDAAFAVALCGRVLSGAPELPAPRPLTAAEEGVVALLALTWIGAGCHCATDAVRTSDEQGGPWLHGVAQDVVRAAAVFADPWVIVLDVQARVGSLAGTVHVLLPEALVTAAPLTPISGLRRLELCPVRCHVELGRGLVPAAQVAALAAGDVVMLDDLRLHPERGGPAQLRAGHLVFPLRVAPDGVAMVADAPREVSSCEGDPMPENPTGVPSSERLAALEVEVAAEIGRVVLSGREIAGLAPGAVVELRRPLGGPVDLLVHGRLVARGELVDVDGEVGVRVVEGVG